MPKRYISLDDLAGALNALRPTETVRESAIAQLLATLALSDDEAERFYILATTNLIGERVPIASDLP